MVEGELRLSFYNSENLVDNKEDRPVAEQIIMRLKKSEYVKKWRRNQVTITQKDSFGLQLDAFLHSGTIAVNKIQIKTGHCDQKHLKEDQEIRIDFENGVGTLRSFPNEHMFRWAMAKNVGSDNRLNNQTLNSNSGHVWAFDLHPYEKEVTNLQVAFSHPALDVSS